jgi:hypothetical protein
LWDDLLQRTGANALAGTLLGTGDVFNGQSAIHEMAKEPRFMRRALSEAMRSAIANFPDTIDRPGVTIRNLSFMPSFYREKGYVFLQIRHPNITDYDGEYRTRRRTVLEIACGVASIKMSHLKMIIGIIIDAPKFTNMNSEDFILLRPENLSQEDRAHYARQNEGLRFFESPRLKKEIITVSNFPELSRLSVPKETGRNDPCPCKSGLKYKKCHGQFR